MPWRLENARGWWLLARDVAVVAVALVIILHDTVLSPPTDPATVGIAGAMIAGVFANRQDEKDRDGK